MTTNEIAAAERYASTPVSNEEYWSPCGTATYDAAILARAYLSLIAERDETTLRNTQRELLVDFVEECASDILNRVSPGCKARAKDILSALNIANPAGGA